MKLTTKGQYALQAILDLTFSSNGKPVRLQEISERQKISLHYLEQLFRRLRKGNVVKSVRGPGGGYVLKRDPKAITLLEILTAVGESIEFTMGTHTMDLQETKECALTNMFLLNSELTLKNHLGSITLNSIMAAGRAVIGELGIDRTYV